MVAPVTFDCGTPILDPLELRPEWCAMPANGDAHTPRAALKRATPGTLWERVGESAPEAAAITYRHPGEVHDCYPRNAFLSAAQGKGIPRYTGPDCDREHVATVHALTFPAAVQALYAGDSYAAYIQASMAESVARGGRDGAESLGELFIGNDGD